MRTTSEASSPAMGLARHPVGVALLALCVCVAACSLWRPHRAPPQGWWSERGPVVPHDSFPADCSLCHVGDDWNEIRSDFRYDHQAQTGVALVGAHAKAECLRCHNDRGPTAAFAVRGCRGCHQDVHLGELGSDCAVCHDELNWQPKGFVLEHARTRFPLVGAHAATACWRCHEGARVGHFTRESSRCEDCHARDLALVSDPDHAALGWVLDCGRCHLPTTWGGVGFQHFGFPLDGAHAALDCSACHANQVFVGLPTDCFGCHQDDYSAAQDPDHLTLMLSTMCSDCHTTSSWYDAHFSHLGISSGCVDCHLADYQETTDPNHALENLSHDCEQCHTTDTWSGAAFSHAGITSGCAECHLDDYQATSEPNHAQAGFPVSCESCHNTVAWSDATFDHNFPINSGDHSGLDCIDCHLAPRSFAIFSCTHCHEHRQSEADDEHDDVRGYVWESMACYQCHPNGDD